MSRIVAELQRDGDNATLRYLCGDRDFELAIGEGFKGYPYLPVRNEKYIDVLDIFTKRLPPRSRGDFSKYMDSIRIKGETYIDDFTLLGYSGAKLPDDDFTLIHPFDNAITPFEFLVDVSGTRYQDVGKYYERLDIGAQVDFVPEPDNLWDSNAIAVLYDNIQLGYVCRGILPEFHRWLKQGLDVKGTIEKKNGTSDKPRIHLFVRVS
ncbi:MAG TPA: HIRAN domain-containing protein [Spirochaetota bacterium]|nr:HIRAN domain-containing protein [Spirochaetota bacterium]